MSLTKPKSSRLLHIDALKAFAAQLIVLHHLSAYGPIADAIQTLAPQLIAALYHYGRMAVQVFLVVGGFLSARAFSARGQLFEGSLPEQLWRRYLRLTLPFMAAVLLTLVCSALIASWLPELAPESVGLPQLLAHATLLHGVLGYESLTVGAWYVAVDFQLFALLLLILCLARGLNSSFVLARSQARFVGPALVLLLSLASLFAFNRDASLDIWAPYYFGAYGLGALVHWLGLVSYRRAGLYLISAAVLIALLLDFRERVALALLTAWVLAWLQQRHQSQQCLLADRRIAPLLAHLGTHSYALFLVHFPICLLVNGLFEHRDAEHAWSALLAALLALALSNMAAVPFYRWVEAPSARLRVGPLLARLLPKASRS
ncbi:acyltransferase family protein [Roseateles oligotrophus]|uniref:Acyltransferase family protein n=1 Tax=Roseateles oligotrophus TaxID=1769250 RepID=A0ABT2YCT2_9BURK|nr:acyltransferase family protein [Roseateles oligotrophus]MCV2367847.1 acyltransferase family protein [Roseateles oligotrophus]